jgi:hypothetical protein
MCSMRIIQCAAVTQDTRLALTSSDTKMSARHQLPIDSPPSSPFCSKSYADFVTEKELLQAKADVEECYRRRARRAGLEETLLAGRPMTEEEIDELSQRLGDWEPANGIGSRGTKCSKEVIEMTIEEMEAEIRETNALIRRRRRRGVGLLPMPLALLMCLMVSAVDGFTAYDCSNRTNVVESYSFLEPDACANMGKDGEVETSVYGEVAQVKQDRMIPVFRCGDRDPGGPVLQHVLSGRSQAVHPVSGAPAPRGLGVPAGEVERPGAHQREDAGGQDWRYHLPHHVPDWRAGRREQVRGGVVTLPDGRVLNGQVAQGLYEITLREEFARLNELTGSLTLTLGVQAAAGDKSIVDSLEGTVVWEYDAMACPQMIVKLFRGMMKAYVNQTNTYEESTVVVEHQDKDQAAGLELA